jgi:two-component system LytT family response regulator
MQKLLKAIIVDDEESARSVLSSLLTRYCPEVTILNTYTNVIDAVEGIKKEQPDVVFLDIEMPNYAGYELVSFFEEVNFDIVFVTAYDNFAIKAFEVSAVDYLLKPVEIERLKAAVEKLVLKNKLKTISENYSALTENLKSDKIEKIVVRNNNGQEIVLVKDIVAIEAKEAYSCIHTISGDYLMSKNLKHYETTFENDQTFFRSHKSWIINLNYIVKFSKSNFEIELSNKIIAKLSKYKKPDFERIILQ